MNTNAQTHADVIWVVHFHWSTIAVIIVAVVVVGVLLKAFTGNRKKQ